MHTFKGVGVAIVTPFKKEDKSIDYKALENLINHLINGKVDYIVVQGTTGENATLSYEEKRDMLEYCIEVVKGRIKVVFGYGGNNTSALLKGFSQYPFDKVDGILSVSPYYNKPNQEGIYNHYKLLSQSAPKPIILYNVPGRTGSNMTAETTLRLANDFKNIVAIKEASANLEQMSKIIKGKPEGFELISGDDGLTVPIISIGGIGVISVAANVYPSDYAQMVESALKNDYAKARKIHHSLSDFVDLIFSEGNPVGAKAALELAGIMDRTVREPLWESSDKLILKLKEEMNRIKTS